MPNISFYKDSRDRLYYDQYTYAITFRMVEACSMRVVNHAAIDRSLEYRQDMQRLYNFRNAKVIAQDTVDKLHDLCDRLLAFKNPYKKLIYTHNVYLYSNSLEDLETVMSADYVTLDNATQAVVDKPRDTVQLKNPKYQYRTYLKERWLTQTEAAAVKKFLLAREDYFRYTPALKQRLQTHQNFYTMGYFFVDHNDPRDVVMLDLVCPGLIRKTMPIQAK